jgi:hypothetical protein
MSDRNDTRDAARDITRDPIRDDARDVVRDVARDEEIGGDVAKSIFATLRRLTYATILGYVISILIAIGAGYFANANREGACALRSDLTRRVETSKNFLLDHPRGAPALGFSRADILKEIHNQESTRDSLNVIICF